MRVRSSGKSTFSAAKVWGCLVLAFGLIVAPMARAQFGFGGQAKANSAHKLTANDGAAGDGFASSLAFDGTVALIGAPGAAVGGHAGQGAVYVFVQSGGSWHQAAKLDAADGAAGDAFGTAVALAGDTAWVGAPLAAVGGHADQGAVYVFTQSNGAWRQTAKLVAGDGAAGDHFGTAVAGSLANGRWVLVGAPRVAFGANHRWGAAYEFRESDGAWKQVEKLVPSVADPSLNGGLSPGAGFGSAVAYSNAFDALVGAPHLKHEVASLRAGITSGAAFARQSGSPGQMLYNRPDRENRPGDGFAAAVALEGSAPLIGASGANLVYVYGTAGQGWSYLTALAPPDAASVSEFGAALAAATDGDWVVVGAPGSGAGTAYLFVGGGTSWSEGRRLGAPDGAAGDRFGASVAVIRGAALVGAPGATVGGHRGQGAAYLFTNLVRPPASPTPSHGNPKKPEAQPAAGAQKSKLAIDALALNPAVESLARTTAQGGNQGQAPAPPETQTWLDASGNPLVRFTAKSHDKVFPVKGPQADREVQSMQLRIVTGRDDLRGGKHPWQNCDVTIELKGRAPIVMRNVNGGQTWHNGSVHTMVVPVPKGLRAGDVTGVKLETGFRGGFGHDNWDVARVQLLATVQ